MKRMILGFLLLAGILVACEKNDKDTAFGTATIYMPQATAGGRYTVPSGLDSATRNYNIDATGKVNVILGASRSGLQGAGGYAVSVTADADTVAQLITAKILDPAKYVVMPNGLFTLPASLSVPAGKNEGSFYMTMDKAALKNYAGKTLVMGVELGNASAYPLQAGLNKVIVMVEVDKLPL